MSDTMKKIKFTKGNLTIYKTGKDPYAAMEAANKALPLGDGMWSPNGEDSYVWIEGNFFD